MGDSPKVSSKGLRERTKPGTTQVPLTQNPTKQMGFLLQHCRYLLVSTVLKPNIGQAVVRTPFIPALKGKRQVDPCASLQDGAVVAHGTSLHPWCRSTLVSILGF